MIEIDLTKNIIELELTRNIVEVETIKIETLMSFVSFAHVVTEKREVQ